MRASLSPRAANYASRLEWDQTAGMIEPLLYLLGRHFALVTILYIAAWAVCFRQRRTRWVLPVWVSVAFPLALITLRWLRLFGFRTPYGPDGGFVAMEASF